MKMIAVTPGVDNRCLGKCPDLGAPIPEPDKFGTEVYMACPVGVFLSGTLLA